MTLAAMRRATRGHTGHELTASALTVVIYATVITASVLRVAAGILPQVCGAFLEFSGIAWMAAFGLFLFECAPMSLRPRSERLKGQEGVQWPRVENLLWSNDAP